MGYSAPLQGTDAYALIKPNCEQNCSCCKNVIARKVERRKRKNKRNGAILCLDCWAEFSRRLMAGESLSVSMLSTFK